MKNALRLALGALCALAFSVAAQAADLVAGLYKANQAIGDVTYKLPGSSEFLPVVNGRPLPQGVVIKTGAKSTVSIEFNSGATALIRPNTQIEISKFEQALFSGGATGPEEPAVSSTKMMLLNGEVVSNVKKLKTGSEYVVNTPIGAAGVRGTTFQVVYDPTNKVLRVLTAEGKVVFNTTANVELPVDGGTDITLYFETDAAGEIRVISTENGILTRAEILEIRGLFEPILGSDTGLLLRPQSQQPILSDDIP